MRPALSLRHTSPQFIPEWERDRFWTVMCDGWPVGTIVEHPTAAGLLPAWQWTVHLHAGRFGNGIRAFTAIEGDGMTRDACLAPFRESFERCLEYVGLDGWAQHVSHLDMISPHRDSRTSVSSDAPASTTQCCR